jgi:Lipoate-protein ligase A
MSRLIDLGSISAELSVRAEQVLFDTSEENTLILYSRNESVISSGKFQNISECVTENAIEDNIKIIRRSSGGSCIFSSEKQITYSLILTRSMDRNVSFETICNCLVSALEFLGVKGSYKHPNDVLVEGLKISGSAQYRSDNRMMQHGTIIIQNEQAQIERYLVRKEGSVNTTSLEDVLGRVPDRTEIKEALIKGFKGFLGNIREEELTAETIISSCRSDP